MIRIELLYVWYAWTLAVLLVLAGEGVPGRWGWVAGHVLVVFPALALRRAPNWLRYAAACLFVPAAFSSLGILIPDLVPEAMEWKVALADRALGGEALRSRLSAPPPWLVELCQVCYSTFYFLPLALALAFHARGRKDAIPRLAELVVGGFLLSYLGYLCCPTLPPYRFLEDPDPLVGGPLFGFLNRVLYEWEPLRQDCMPSGHTMITLCLWWAAWKTDPLQLLWLLPVGSFLILGTLVLRYHWGVDLLAGLAFAVLAILLFRGGASPSPGKGEAVA